MVDQVDEKAASPRLGQTDSDGTDRSSGHQDNSPTPQKTNDTSEKKPNKLKQLWSNAGLDFPTIALMFKGSLPPIIAIAMYQAKPVAAQYQTLGYLVAITSILGFCIMPRAKFIQTMTLNVVTICVAAAVNLLVLFCAVKAREHTTPAGASPAGYNSSASAVLGVWLFAQVFFINALRAARPQWQFPAILYSIFVSVSCTYGTQFPTMPVAISFMKRLLEAFLTGFALATGVSFFVFPMSSRMVVWKEMTGFMMCMSRVLSLQAAHMESLEHFEFEKPEAGDETTTKKARSRKSKTSPDPRQPFTTPALMQLRGVLAQTYELHGKINGDIAFAKREIGFGKLGPHHISELFKKMQQIMVPISGLVATIDIMNRRAEAGGWTHENLTDEEIAIRAKHVENLHYLMTLLHEPFKTMSGTINEGIQHILITLEFTKPPKKTPDEESQGSEAPPGSTKFAEHFKNNIDAFYSSKEMNIRQWCEDHGIELPIDFFKSTFVRPESLDLRNEHIRERHQRQLFVVLYVDHLLYRTALSVLDLVLWADECRSHGVLARNRLLFPGLATLSKWAAATLGREDVSNEDHYTAEMDASGVEALNLGASFAARKDPEHLPPRNALERVGEAVRQIPKALRSESAAFGFRVAAATMSIAIICFLHDTQNWFLRNRVLWAMIMTAISMTRTAGQSTFSFLLRIFGTVVAMIGSYIIWYIVDGKKAGVIVFLWFWIFCAFYVVLKKPKLIIVGLLSLVTAVLIVGYELQVDVIGVQASESNGQPAYPTYLLAPYRLAAVLGGLGVAWIWTIFPYPVQESTILRLDLGATLYLLANFTSIVHETVKSRVNRTDGDAQVKGTRAYHLQKARTQVFTKGMLLITSMQMNSAFSRFQLTVGGRFPRETYETLIQSVQRVFQYSALLSYASAAFSSPETSSEWSQDFRRLLANANVTSHKMTSHLSLLSSAMTDGRPLPPYLEVPHHAQYLRQMEDIDHDILSTRHIAEPEYSAFAVIQICVQCINDDVTKITKCVKQLVGEIDFSFHVVSTGGESSDESLSDSIAGAKKPVSDHE